MTDLATQLKKLAEKRPDLFSFTYSADEDGSLSIPLFCWGDEGAGAHPLYLTQDDCDAVAGLLGKRFTLWWHPRTSTLWCRVYKLDWSFTHMAMADEFDTHETEKSPAAQAALCAIIEKEIGE